MDPDEFVKEYGGHELERQFVNSSPLSQSLFEFALTDLGLDRKRKFSAEDKAKIEAYLTLQIAQIKDFPSKKYFTGFVKDALFRLGKTSKAGDKKAENFSLDKQKKIWPSKSKSGADQSLALQIMALVIKFPELINLYCEGCNFREIHFDDVDLDHVRELLVELIDHEKQSDEKELLKAIENSNLAHNLPGLKSIIISLSGKEPDLVKVQFRILLLKYLLKKVEQQYEDSLNQIDEIKTHQTAILTSSIKEIFAYKKSLEQEILTLTKEII
jgi:DNA primase